VRPPMKSSIWLEKLTSETLMLARRVTGGVTVRRAVRPTPSGASPSSCGAHASPCRQKFKEPRTKRPKPLDRQLMERGANAVLRWRTADTVGASRNGFSNP